MTKRGRIFNIALLLVLTIGFIGSIELSYIHFKVSDSAGDYKSFCNINDTINCDTVAVSPWATLFGVPIAILGMLSYLFAMCLAGLRLTSWRARLPHAGIYLWWMAALSVLYSCYLAWICYAEIGAWCLMCMVLYLVNIFYVIFAWLALDIPFLEHSGSLLKDLRWILASWLRMLAVLIVLSAIVAVFTAGHAAEQKAKAEKLSSVMKKLKKLDKPVPLEGNVIGNPDGKVVIVIFSDYQCPHCSTMELQLEKLTARYKELKVIKKDFPLDNACNPLVERPFHLYACEASRYKICADRQGKFMEFNHRLLHNRESINSKFLSDSVKLLGLDEEKMAQCLVDPETRFTLRKDIRAGLLLQLKGTPALIFNGDQMVTAGLTFEEIERLVQIKSENL